MDREINCPHCNQGLEVDEDLLGAEVHCPACLKAFTAGEQPPPPPAPGQTQACPFCGETILAVAKKCKHCGEFIDGSAPRQAGGARSAPTSATTDLERPIWSGHPSHWYFLGEHIIGVLLWVVVVGFLINLKAYLSATKTRYAVTSKRVAVETGILSSSTAEVAIRDIRSLNFHQGMLERMLGLGTIEIGTAGHAGIEVVLHGVPRARWLKDQLSALKNAAN